MGELVTIISNYDISLEDTGKVLYVTSSGININFPEHESPDNFDEFNCIIINDTLGDVFLVLPEDSYTLISNRACNVSGDKSNGYNIYYTPGTEA